MMSYHLITAPTEFPVTVAEAKAHLVVEHSLDDQLLTGFIAAATEYVQNQTNEQLCTATWEMRGDRFPSGDLKISKVPISAATITYTDVNGDAQTVENLQVKSSKPALVRPAYGESWPTARNEFDSVVVSLTAGYGDAIPQGYKQAILLLVSHWYERREAAGSSVSEIPFGVNELLFQFHWSMFASY